jgi:hypothetical protein
MELVWDVPVSHRLVEFPTDVQDPGTGEMDVERAVDRSIGARCVRGVSVCNCVDRASGL